MANEHVKCVECNGTGETELYRGEQHLKNVRCGGCGGTGGKIVNNDPAPKTETSKARRTIR